MTVSDTQLANAIRALSMDAVQAANSGHPGMPQGDENRDPPTDTPAIPA